MNQNLRQLQSEVAAAIANLSAGDWARHPLGKWTAAEIVEHLYLTYTGTIKGFDRMLESGGPHTTPASLRQRVGKLLVLGFGYLPPGREAPKMSRPKGLPQEKVLAEIAPKIAEMDEFIANCEQKFGAGTKLLDHVILGPLTGAQWRKFHLVHGRHHLKQIRRLQDFPG